MLAELREARERVHSLYCLPVDMWTEWLEDEHRLLGPDDDPSELLELYQKALKDYRYYKVCKKYCKFILALYETGRGATDEQAVRDAFEKVLQIYGLDVNRSHKFWEPYLKFEKDQLDKIQNQESEDYQK